MKNNSPNENIVTVDNIIGWSSLMNDRLDNLQVKTVEQKYAISQAREQIDVLQRVDLHRLRKAFE